MPIHTTEYIPRWMRAAHPEEGEPLLRRLLDGLFSESRTEADWRIEDLRLLSEWVGQPRLAWQLPVPEGTRIASISIAASAVLPGSEILDSFDDSDGTLLPSHTISPLNDPGTGWVALNGSAAVSGNRVAKFSTSQRDNLLIVDNGHSDVVAELDFVFDSGAGRLAELDFRVQDSNNRWRILTNGNEMRIFEVVGGVITPKASTSMNLTQGVTYRLQGSAIGNTITASLSGAAQGTITLTATSSALNSVTRHGFYVVSAIDLTVGALAIERFYLAGASVFTVSPRPARSEYEFYTTSDAVYLAQPRQLLLRNLERITHTETPRSDYTVPVGDLVSDSPLYLFVSGIWERIAPTPGRWQEVDTLQDVTLSLSPSGTAQFLDRAAASINGGPPVALTPYDLPNRWDSWGASVALPRFLRETNRDYRDRLLTAYACPGGHTLNQLRSAVARQIGLLSPQSWDTSQTLSIPAASGVKEAYVVDWSRLVLRDETVAQRDGTYTLTHTPLDQLLLIFCQDRLVPFTLSGRTVTLTAPPSASLIRAVYLYARWTLTRDGSGNITALTPVAYNWPQRTVTVHYARQVLTRNLPREKTRYFEADGRPTATLQEIAFQIDSQKPFTLGSTRWGRGHWFSASETQPEETYLPRMLDDF